MLLTHNIEIYGFSEIYGFKFGHGHEILEILIFIWTLLFDDFLIW